MKKTYSVRLDPVLIEQVKIKAKFEHRTFSNYIELALIDSLKVDCKQIKKVKK